MEGRPQAPKQLCLGESKGSLSESVCAGGDAGSRSRCKRKYGEDRGRGGQRLEGRWRVPSRKGRVPPAPRPHPLRRGQSSTSLCVPRAAGPWLVVLPGVPSRSEATCTLNHPRRALPSRIAGSPRAGPSPRPPQSLFRRSSAGPGKTRSGVPPRGAHQNTGSWAVWGGDPGLGSFPDSKGGMRAAGRTSRARGPTCRQEVPCRHCPVTRATAAPTPGSALGPWAWALPFPGQRAILFSRSSVGRRPSRAASSRARAAPVRRGAGAPRS